MPNNQLIHEKSPYLRQHATNPVEWLPWGEAAFEKARREDKPIFLSIGYSTCHWCHVMAHESFEDVATAEVMNRFFVPVKLDREERPDIDRIYMLFVQSTTGSGGWPMSVWMTPDLKPFYGGTYFPPTSKFGRPGFRDLLQYLAQAWESDRPKIHEASVNVADHLLALTKSSAGEQALSQELFKLGYGQLERSFDEQYGGFGSAPKFPRPVSLNYLLRYYALEKSEDALEMVLATLRAMDRGGMHDQLGGGFHRYSVDERWFVPHFEKMLYDQAQLAMSYLEAFQITGDGEFARVVRDICDYVLRDMTDPLGGFYSAEDADSADPDNPSQHREGAFYVWREREIKAALGPSSDAFCRYFGVRPEGNVDNDPHAEFSGQNILSRTGADVPDHLARDVQRLFELREKRPRPHLDNKVLTSWNGLMISALARAAVALPEPRYLSAARSAADFLLTRMFDAGSGALLRRYCEGEAAVPGFADDYFFFAQALTDLFEASGEAAYLRSAVRVVQQGIERFGDHAEGGFFSTADSASDLLVRLKDDYDGAEPSANSVAADVILRLAHLTGDAKLQEEAEKVLLWFGPKLRSQPTAAPQMAVALARYLSVPEQSIYRARNGDDVSADVLLAKRRQFNPSSTTLVLSDESANALQDVAPFLASLKNSAGVTLYECRNLVCDLPQILR